VLAGSDEGVDVLLVEDAGFVAVAGGADELIGVEGLDAAFLAVGWLGGGDDEEIGAMEVDLGVEARLAVCPGLGCCGLGGRGFGLGLRVGEAGEEEQG